MPENKEIEIRSDEVQEILSAVPNWMIRWGITLIFGLILLLVFISWFIKYPDVVAGQANITTITPPVKLVSKTNGYLEQLFFEDNTSVKKGQIIAEITNPTNKENIQFLDSMITQFSVDCHSDRSDNETEESFNRNSISLILNQFSTKNILIGNELPDVNSFVDNLTELNALLTDEYYQKNIENLNQQITYNNQLAAITKTQLSLLKQEMKNAQEKFKADSTLYQKGYTAKHEFFKNQSELMAKKQELANLQKTYVNYKVSVTNYQKQKNETTQQFENKKRTLITSISANINTIKNYINNWQQNYTVTSPIDGKLSYLTNLTENQFVKSQNPLFAVVSNNQNYIGHITISTQGFGKVVKGQKVRIKLNNYPYQEFGQIIGKVTDISLVPTAINENKEAYFITISLPQKLITTYKKELEYTPEMLGTAEIVTKDLRLLERIFNKFRKVFDQ
jgi:HlyD family type I secretion membrane fusion protein